MLQPNNIHINNNIHIKMCAEGAVAATLAALRESPATARYKAKFILATDGKLFEAENLVDGETLACDYAKSEVLTQLAELYVRVEQYDVALQVYQEQLKAAQTAQNV